MMNNINIKFDDIFPTKLLTIDASNQFTAQEIDSMTDHIDDMIKNDINIIHNERYPKVQSSSVLFLDKSPPLFSKKLLDLFAYGCQMYNDKVSNFSPNQDKIIFTKASAWFYCSWPEMFENNPWHGHNPAYLSGIFYLKNSGDPATSGTEFHDPRGPISYASAMVYTQGVQGHLVIFPGWLHHRPMQDVNNKERRYVIACNMYVAAG